MYCTTCGTELAEGARACGACGTMVAGASATRGADYTSWEYARTSVKSDLAQVTTDCYESLGFELTGAKGTRRAPPPRCRFAAAARCTARRS